MNGMKMRDMGFLALSLFLIIWGLVFLFSLSFSGLQYIEGILALVAGVLIGIDPFMSTTTTTTNRT
jgi:hypothetical protein